MTAFLQRSRHGTIFYFRRKIPLALRARVKQTQVYVSLGSADRSTALRTSRLLAIITDDLFQRLQEGDENMSGLLEQLLAEHKLTGVLRQRIERLETELIDARVLHMRTVKDLKDSHLEHLAVLRQPFSGPAAQPKFSRFTVAEAIREYVEKREMKASARKRYLQVLGHFERFAGPSTRLNLITQSRFVEYCDHVATVEAWSRATRNLYMGAACSMLNWHKDRGEPVEPITASSLKLRRLTPASSDRDAFSLDQMEVVFREAAAFRDKDAHWFWVVVICAFTGVRVEELAQADVQSDFRQDAETGRWYLDINENIGPGGHKKSVKKESGWRVVPLHHELIRLGFLDYLEAQRRAGARTLFEKGWEPLALDEKGSLKFSHGITKRGSRALARLKKSGKLEEGKTSFFHSLRHTFISQLAAKGVPAEMRCALTGHKPEGGGMNTGRYTKLKAQVAPKLPTIDDNLNEFVERLRASMEPTRLS
jgi:integrase